MDSQDKYCFIKHNNKHNVTRVNLSNNETKTIFQHDENFIYAIQVYHLVSQNKEVIVCTGDRDEGIHIYDINTCEQYLHKKFGVDDDCYQLAYIKHLDILVSADGKGHIRLLDMRDFKALEAEDSPAI